jgi:Fur family transcriptional regulator, ferric uptake regulator
VVAEGLQDEHILTAALRAGGHRLTEPRRAVWAALHDGGTTVTDAHLTVDEVTDRAHALGFRLDRASAYRALSLLEELGLVRVSHLDAGDAVRWEVAHPDEHFHLRCVGCGAVEHHVGTLVARIREHLDEGHGFAVSTVSLTVHGHCTSCRPHAPTDTMRSTSVSAG